MTAYYNEIDKFKAAWLRELITAGSILFVETWKRKATPLRRRYWEHTASAHRISGSGFTSWPSPNTPSGGPNAKSTETHTGGMDLEGAATFASWATPAARDFKSDSATEEFHERQWAHTRGKPLSAEAGLAGWPTPSVVDDNNARRGPESTEKQLQRENPMKQLGDHGDPFGLGDAAQRGFRMHGSASGDTGHAQIARTALRPSPLNGFWRDADWIGCRDGKWRPVEPGTFPLVAGAPARVGRLRGYGDAIVAPVAQAFIEAYIATERG